MTQALNNTTNIAKTPATPNDRPNDGWEKLLSDIQESFNDALDAMTGRPEAIFTTLASEIDLFDIFLKNLPEEARQHYNCNACRHFVNTYGHLATIDDRGDLHPLMWQYAPSFFERATDELYNAVKRSKATGMFFTSSKVLGTPKTGVWTHMSVAIPAHLRYKNRLKTADQRMAEKREDFKMLMHALNKYDLETIKTAVNLLNSDTLYRSEKIAGIADWFLRVAQTADSLRGKTMTYAAYNNRVWKYVAEAPEGFCHISSSMIGTLLDDIQDGYTLETVKRKFDEKMNPLKYQRPKTAPGYQNVLRAEKIVEELGLRESLKRRFARLDEIETIWKPAIEPPAKTPTGVFAGIKTKEQLAKKTNDIQPSEMVMTWEKFVRTVLPVARKIEVILQSGRSNFAAMVTAVDPNANPIIQWDTEEHRNPVSWYLYNGGSYASTWNMCIAPATVTGIALQPNMWQPGYEHHGAGALFILEDCKDGNNKSSGLFPEILRSELREVRHTIEAYSNANELGGYDEASACGILIQSGFKIPVWLRVTTDVGVRNYKLDRWD